MHDITYTNITMRNVGKAIHFEPNEYGWIILPTNDTATPKLYNININNLRGNASIAWYLDGIPEAPMYNMNFSNIYFDHINEFIEVDKNVSYCNHIYGYCDNATVKPYCPPCIKPESEYTGAPIPMTTPVVFTTTTTIPMTTAGETLTTAMPTPSEETSVSNIGKQRDRE